jgi:hypothetical protein
VATCLVGNRTLSAAQARCSCPVSVKVGGFAFIRTQLSRCRLSLSASAPLMLARAVPGFSSARGLNLDRPTQSENIRRDTTTSAIWKAT